MLAIKHLYKDIETRLKVGNAISQPIKPTKGLRQVVAYDKHLLENTCMRYSNNDSKSAEEWVWILMDLHTICRQSNRNSRRRL